MKKTKAAYQEYLKSPHWLGLRSKVFQRDGYRCTRCQSKHLLQAHHKFYRDKWEDSVPDDLITLCRKCHKLEHGIWKPKKAVKKKKIHKWLEKLKANQRKRERILASLPKRVGQFDQIDGRLVYNPR